MLNFRLWEHADAAFPPSIYLFSQYSIICIFKINISGTPTVWVFGTTMGSLIL